jgi:hypothetical protein
MSASCRILRHAGPDELGKVIVEFRLTYEGPLYAASNSGSRRVRHKHEIRRIFHKQLRIFWDGHPFLNKAIVIDPEIGYSHSPRVPLKDDLGKKYARCGYNFVPLVTPDLTVSCRLDILCLRPGRPGEIIQSGDLDNRIKTLFDALRIPENGDELGGYTEPQEDEKPFYCLLSDDRLISHVSLETDLLLAPTSAEPDENDVRLIIRIELRPEVIGWHNINFG